MEADKMEVLVRNSVMAAFEKSFSLVPEDLYFDNFNDMEEECVISSISFRGLLEGSLTITMPESSACILVGRMLNQAPPDELNYDAIDGIGELTNMVIGGVKMNITDPNYYFDISIPTCVRGSRMVVLSGVKDAYSISRNYKVEDVVFAVSILYTMKATDEEKEKLKKQALDKLNLL